MKKSFLLLFAVVCCALWSAHAQKNNPYNQRGLDYFASLDMITEDFKAGKVKELSEESIAHYSNLLPLKVSVNAELAGQVYKAIKSGKPDLVGKIDELKFTEISKMALKGILQNYSGKPEYQEYLSALSDKVNTASIPENEKQIVLTLTAIAYNGTINSINNTSRFGDCTLSGSNGSGSSGSGSIPCWLAGAVGGAIIGVAIPGCEWLCPIAGAIIGGIVGGLS